MDRPLDAGDVRNRTRKRRVVAGSTVCAGVVAFLWAPGLLRPTVDRAQVRLAVVDAGAVDAVLTTTGTVVPEAEQAISSPLDARVLRILKRPGTPVQKGEAIVELDLGASVLAVEKLDRLMALKTNEQLRTRLALAGTLDAVQGRHEIKGLQADALRAAVRRNRELFGHGLIAQETVTASELAAHQADIELRQIGAERRHAQEAAEAQVAGLALELGTLQRERDEARRQVELGTTRADRSGVITWAVAEEGVLVHRGDVLARVADLGSFRVEATLSDVHARTVSAGLAAVVRVGAETLTGTVDHVEPAIQNGVMKVLVKLDQPGSPLLRPHLRVDVDVVTARRTGVLRLERGPGVPPSGTGDMFVVRGGRALRTPVRIGVVGSSRCEVMEGLVKGDEVIVSDTRRLLQAKEISVR